MSTPKNPNTPQHGDMVEMTERPQEKAARKHNEGHVKPTSSAPPDQDAPTPGADVDSSDGLQSGRGRNAELNGDPVPREDIKS